MKNKSMQIRLSTEVINFVHSRKSLLLASIGEDGAPYASYAPFAVGDDCLYVLLSEIAVHGRNLQREPRASVLVVEDEDTAGELYARIRVNYSVQSDLLAYGSDSWRIALQHLELRHGELPIKLSTLEDFRMFRLVPKGGRYVKGFGRAFALAGDTLAGEVLNHMTDGHRQRVPETKSDSPSGRLADRSSQIRPGTKY